MHMIDFPRARHLVALLLAAAPAFVPALAATRFTAEYTLSLANSSNDPPAASLSTKALRGSLSMLGGQIEAGTLSDNVVLDGTSYRITAQGSASSGLRTLIPSATLSRISEGRLGGGYPATSRFVEKRGSKEAVTVQVDYTKRTATYWRGKEQRKVEAVQYRLADAASLAYVFFRQPAGRGAVTVAATDGLSTRLLVLDPHDDQVEIGGRKIAATRWVRRPSADGGSFELWVRKEDGFPLRVRLGLSSKYGIVLHQQLKQLPTLSER